MAIIKTISYVGLQESPKYFDEAYSKGQVPEGLNAEYVCLTDTGGLYAIRDSSEGWWAKLFLADPEVKERTNIFRMMIGAKPTRETSNDYKSLKELKAAIERSHERVEKLVREGQGMTDEEYKVFVAEARGKVPETQKRESNPNEIQVPFTFPCWYFGVVFLFGVIGIAGIFLLHFGVVLTSVLPILILGFLSRKPKRN